MHCSKPFENKQTISYKLACLGQFFFFSKAKMASEKDAAFGREICGALAVSLNTTGARITPAALVALGRHIDKAVLAHRCNVECPYLPNKQEKLWCFSDDALVVRWVSLWNSTYQPSHRRPMPACPRTCFSEAAFVCFESFVTSMGYRTLVTLSDVYKAVTYDADANEIIRDIHPADSDQHRFQVCLVRCGMRELASALTADALGSAYVAQQEENDPKEERSRKKAWYHYPERVETEARLYATLQSHHHNQHQQGLSRLVVQVTSKNGSNVFIRHGQHMYSYNDNAYQGLIVPVEPGTPACDPKAKGPMSFLKSLAALHKTDASTSPLYEANHPMRVRAHFTARLVEQAMIDANLCPLPLVLLQMVGEYEPAHLACFEADMMDTPRSSSSLRAPTTAEYKQAQPAHALPHHLQREQGLATHNIFCVAHNARVSRQHAIDVLLEHKGNVAASIASIYASS